MPVFLGGKARHPAFYVASRAHHADVGGMYAGSMGRCREICQEGVRIPRIREIMGKAEYQITIDLGLGRGEDRVWTCDLSEEYVRLNAEYTT